MRHLAALTLSAIAVAAAGPVQALVCSVPGTTLAWATDQCLLEAGQLDPRAEAVVHCLAKAKMILQPCEWDETYKRKYCETLLAKSKFDGSLPQCVADPTTVGPTVRQLLGAAGEA